MGLSGGSSSQQSSGWGYGYNQSLSQAMSASDVWGAQAPALQGGYDAASALARRQMPQVGAAATRLGGATMPAAQTGLEQMMQFANPNSDLARRQTADLADTVGSEFGRTILPQIRTGAGIGGNMGGSREALAKGVAAGDAAQAISQGGTEFFSNAYNQAAAAAAQLPAMAGQVFNLGMTPFAAQWAPIQSLMGALGGPTVLQRSRAESQSEAQNWQQQQSTGKSKQFGFNLW
jgi:hypothetical protein